MTQFTDEEKQQIEQEFRNSWDRIEKFFAHHNILPLIRELRSRGYDKQTRAGQSLYTLIVSRSRYRIIQGQAHIRFCAGGNHPACDGRKDYMELIISDGISKTTKSLYTITLNEEIEALMQELIKHPITTPPRHNL